MLCGPESLSANLSASSLIEGMRKPTWPQQYADTHACKVEGERSRSREAPSTDRFMQTCVQLETWQLLAIKIQSMSKHPQRDSRTSL